MPKIIMIDPVSPKDTNMWLVSHLLKKGYQVVVRYLGLSHYLAFRLKVDNGFDFRPPTLNLPPFLKYLDFFLPSCFLNGTEPISSDVNAFLPPGRR